MKLRFISGLVAISMLFAPLANAKPDGNWTYGQEQANVAVSNANNASELATTAAKNAEAGKLDAVNQNLADAKTNLANAQKAYGATKGLPPAGGKYNVFIEQARISVDKAQVAVNQIQELSTAMSTTTGTTVAGSTSAPATAAAAGFTGTQIAVAGVIAAGAITAIAVGASSGSSGGSSSTPSH